MDTITHALLTVMVCAQNSAVRAGQRFRSEDGQNTLEYLVLAVFVVLIAVAGFRLAGQSISARASAIVGQILG
jgi:Flp pilus assembly pilin Flp